jgi:YkoY family integral membrane protein
LVSVGEETMFGQTFETHDLAIIGLLIILEGVLSIDNALVLGLLAKRLPKHQQKRALTYGLIGAFVFRLLAIAMASILLKAPIFKLIGGGYLIYVAVKHFFFESRDPEKEHIKLDASGHPILIDDTTGEALSQTEEEREIISRTPAPTEVLERIVKSRAHAAFWPTVFVIEMTDIAFAVDSIIAAIGVVGAPPLDHPANPTHPNHDPTLGHPKLWVVILGGFLGVILMRFAAVLFIKLLDRFPRFETAAYLLVIVIGLKLCIDWAGNKYFATPERPHPVDFHSPSSIAFWVFWIAMLASFAIGFIPKKKSPHDPAPPAAA